jgi:hypothetical protein
MKAKKRKRLALTENAVTEHRVELIQAPSSTIRAAFKNWLATAWRAGARLVVLEGLMAAGKTTLTKPLRVGAGRSVSISIDQFWRHDTPLSGVDYVDAVDRQALQARLRARLASVAPIIVVEAPVAWPLVEPIAEVARDRIRRVYLKRMMHSNWIDEDFLADASHWPPIDFHRSIYQYHAERKPWLDADLVLERIIDEDELGRDGGFVLGVQNSHALQTLKKVSATNR